MAEESHSKYLLDVILFQCKRLFFNLNENEILHKMHSNHITSV